MKLVLLFLSMIFLTHLNAQEYKLGETTFHLDDSLVFLRFDMEPVNGTIMKDSDHEIGKYVNGFKSGVHKAWNEDNVLISEAHFKQSILHGELKKYSAQGVLIEQCDYSLGKKDGISRTWHLNGKLKSEEYYSLGLRDSLSRKWWSNGQLAFLQNYSDEGVLNIHKEWDVLGRATFDFNRAILIQENIVEPPPPDVIPPNPPPIAEEEVIAVVEEIIEFPEVEARFPCASYNRYDSLGIIISQYELCGVERLMKWINTNVRYPERSIEMNEQGRVFLSFVVEKDGSISNVAIERGVSPDLDKEAKRVVRNMPKWTPAMANDRLIRSRLRLPINFQLN